MAVDRSNPGIRQCMKCCRLFVSPDALRIGRCQDCKAGEYSPREARVAQVDGAVSSHHQKDTS